jgi:polyvinyl alcohol dehydrogenase (cytochrome)
VLQPEEHGNLGLGGISAMKRCLLILAALIVILLPAADSALAQSTEGTLGFEQHCATCHGNPTSKTPAPDELQLRRLTAEQIDVALAKAPHMQQEGLTPELEFKIAQRLGGRIPGIANAADAKKMLNHCASNPPITDLSAKPSWNGWGNDPTTNARFQSAEAAGLSADQVPRLALKWAFGFPGAEEVYGQPTVVAGRVFIGVDTGAVYSLDAATGCVYWSFEADAGVRTAISIGPVKGQGSAKYGIYFGDIRANAYMLDATSGNLLWKVHVEDHPLARITGAPTLYQDRLYVPVASVEESAAGFSSVYPCCTFRGSVVALDANTGRTIWKTYIVHDPPRPDRKTSKGVQLWTSNGGAVWSSPTVDSKRHALYVGTGDAYLPPAAKTTDAIVALDMATGKIIWAHQDTENDAWLANCESKNVSENCPKDLGPDFDFGSSPILRTLPNGHRILVAGQKSGMVWGHDPDREGTVRWKAQLVPNLALGMITFGGGADEQNAYFGLKTGGVAALQLTTGEKRWFTSVEPRPGAGPGGLNAALTVIPGVVFSSGWDGVVRAFSSEDGRLIWQYNTVRDFRTVNGPPARGGSMGAPGPTIADGTLFVGSGYVFGRWGGTPGNVLLAFSVQK